VWAASGASGTAIPPIVSLLFVVVVGAIVFTVLRLTSRLVIEGMRHRRRPHARWAHFLTGTFLAVVGISYFLDNSFLGQGSTFMHQVLQRF
jgi:Na+/H+ antiporter NhaD/arsenite permease-like protein